MLFNIKKFLDLNFYDSSEFEQIAEKMFKFETINGKKVITDESINHVLSIDPIGILEDLTGKKMGDDNLGLALTILHFKKGLENYIAKNSFDIANPYKATIEEYFNLFKSYGFELVQKNEKTVVNNGHFTDNDSLKKFAEENGLTILKTYTEKKRFMAEYSVEEFDFILYSKKFNLFINGSTYYNRINSIRLYFNGEEKNKIGFQAERENLGLSGGFIQGSNLMEGNIDLRDHPARKIDTLIKLFKLSDYFISFDPYIKTYLDEEFTDSRDIAIEKSLKLPNDILEKLTKYNIEHKYVKQIQKHKPELVTEYDRHLDFIKKNISQKDLEELSVKDVLIDFLLRPQYIFDDKIKSIPEFDSLNINLLSSIAFREIQKIKTKNKFTADELIKHLDLLNDTEKQVVLKRLDDKYSRIRFYLGYHEQETDIEKIKKFIENDLKQNKTDNKRKTRLH